MKRARDSVIYESAKYTDAIEKLKAHLSRRPVSKLTAADPIKARGRVKLFVEPFGVDLDTTQVAQVGATTRAWGARGSIGTGAVFEASGIGSKTPLKLADFSPARMVWAKLRADPKRVTPDSTGITYIAYVEETNSIPFGRTSPTDKYGDVRDVIQLDAEAFFTNSLVTFQEEHLGQAWS